MTIAPPVPSGDGTEDLAVERYQLVRKRRVHPREVGRRCGGARLEPASHGRRVAAVQEVGRAGAERGVLLEGLGHQGVRRREQREGLPDELAVDPRQQLLHGVLDRADDQQEAPRHPGRARRGLGGHLGRHGRPGLLCERPGEGEADAVPREDLEEGEAEDPGDCDVGEPRAAAQHLEESPERRADQEDDVQAVRLEDGEELPIQTRPA